MNKQMAAIGDGDSVMGFAALGIHTVTVEDSAQAQAAIFELARDGVAVIFLAEHIAAQIPKTLAQYAATPYPAIIPIPTSGEGMGLGMAQLKANVEKALGTDILFGKEG